MPMLRFPLAPVAVVAVALAGCGRGGDATPARDDTDAVARVGNTVLTEADLAGTLPAVHSGQDAARRQAVDAWVRSELLVQEARREGLDREPGVRRRLADAERATLETAALERLFETASATPSPDDVAGYYAAHRAELALREPYVRLRHLRVTPAQAEAAVAAVTAAAAAPDPDAAFTGAARRFAGRDADGAVAFAAAYAPESRLASLDPALGERVAGLRPSPRAVALETAGGVHVLQVVDRVAAGTVPPLAVIAAELSERLAIEARRDTEARAVERLRAEAVARGDLAPD